MNLITPEQFASMQKANLDTAFGLVRSVADGLEKLTALNLQLSKSLLASSKASWLNGVAEPHTPEASARQAELAGAVQEHAQLYGRQLTDLVSATLADFMRTGEGQANAYSHRVQTFVDDLAKSAPSGSEAAIAAWKSAITTSSTLIETVRKNCEQAMHATESSLAALSSTTNIASAANTKGSASR
jgi:phasin family protein